MNRRKLLQGIVAAPLGALLGGHAAKTYASGGLVGTGVVTREFIMGSSEYLVLSSTPLRTPDFPPGRFVFPSDKISVSLTVPRDYDSFTDPWLPPGHA